jgi:hypothetical protein
MLLSNSTAPGMGFLEDNEVTCRQRSEEHIRPLVVLKIPVLGNALGSGHDHAAVAFRRAAASTVAADRRHSTRPLVTFRPMTNCPLPKVS